MRANGFRSRGFLLRHPGWATWLELLMRRTAQRARIRLFYQEHP